jgi:hypothetical protein
MPGILKTKARRNPLADGNSRGDVRPKRNERRSGSSVAGVGPVDFADDAANENVELMSEPRVTDSS